MAPGSGKIRWVVERSFAWLRAYKRLRTATNDAGAIVNVASPGG
jgi:hypothetical protein